MTYWQLTPRNNSNLEEEILACLRVTLAVWEHQMHRWRYCTGQSPQSLMHDLLQLATKWLQLEKLTRPQIVERVVIDHYLTVLSNELHCWVSHKEPQVMDQLMEMVEQNTMVEDLLGLVKSKGVLSMQKARPPPNPKSNIQNSRGASASVSPGSAPARKNAHVLCWRCHSWDHVQA